MPHSAKALVTSRPYRFVVRRIVVPWILQGEEPVGEGLEIGAGSGAMTAQLLELFPRLRMVATDYDIDLVRSAQRNLAPFGDRARVERADALDLPFPDNRFGFVLSAAMLHHTVAWETCLSEVVRVLRPGGRLIGYDLVDTAPNRLMHLGERHETRLLRPDQLQAEFDRLHTTDTSIKRGIGGLAIRFAATKP